MAPYTPQNLLQPLKPFFSGLASAFSTQPRPAVAPTLSSPMTAPAPKPVNYSIAPARPSITGPATFSRPPVAPQPGFGSVPVASAASITPTTPAVPAATTTSDGKTINPATGGVVNGADVNTQLEDIKRQLLSIQNAPATPATPVVSPQEAGVTNAEAAYKATIPMTPEEEANQKALDDIKSGYSIGKANTENQPIPMEFITGQTASMEKRALALQQPLIAKAALLQAKRTSAVDASKFALERADKALETSKGIGSQFTLGKDQVRYDKDGNVIAGTGGSSGGKYVAGVNPTADAYADAIISGKTKLENIPEEYRGAVAQAIAGKKVTQETSPYLANLAVQGKQAIKGLLDIANNNPGIFGRTAALPLPDAARSDDFRNYKAQLDYLKGNIIPAALSAMREASKTGGALGQVSDREGAWLASSLGALSMDQSSDVVIKQLGLINESMTRWEDAVKQYGGGGTVQTTVGDINTDW